MPLPEDILTPIPGSNPGGQDLRYAPIYEKIKEARREDDELAQGAWQRERKIADHGLVIRLTSDAITKQSKDLQLAVWLSESLLRRDGYAGFAEGLVLCRNLIEKFWDNLYPQLDEGDSEFRAGPLEFIATKFEFPAKGVRLTLDGHDFYQYRDSRIVGYEDPAKSKEQKAARDAQLKSGKIAPEVVDKSFAGTPKAFYVQTNKSLESCVTELNALDEVCREKFGATAPSFTRLNTSLEEIRHVVSALLQKKREIEPDPVEEVKAAVPAGNPDATGRGPETQTGENPAALSIGDTAYTAFIGLAPEEPAERKAAIQSVVDAAAFLRRIEPTNPAPYLMLRGLRWGELRTAIFAKDQRRIEAPPTELRRAIKQLALAGRWKELIETAENAMALPCARAWMDLQRFVVEAGIALGPEYQLIVLAIQSELRALVRDVPEIFALSLMDDTPAANPETQAWLRQLMEEPQGSTPRPPAIPSLKLDRESTAGWQQKFVDVFALSLEAARSGHEQKGFELMHDEIHRQRSGRSRFEKRLQFVQLCAATGKETLAQPLLDDLLAAIDTYKLEEWEDRDMVAAALVTILNTSKKIQADAKEKQKMYERICRLNPVQALSIG